MVIDGKLRTLSSRRFCTACSPFGAHNSSRRPLVDARTRRLQSWVNYSRSQRIRIKAELVDSRGGRCVDCGYARTVSALEFHHRDATSKDFALGASSEASNAPEQRPINAISCALTAIGPATLARRRTAATLSCGLARMRS
jgi:hypothetical protein